MSHLTLEHPSQVKHTKNSLLQRILFQEFTLSDKIVFLVTD